MLQCLPHTPSLSPRARRFVVTHTGVARTFQPGRTNGNHGQALRGRDGGSNSSNGEALQRCVGDFPRYPFTAFVLAELQRPVGAKASCTRQGSFRGKSASPAPESIEAPADGTRWGCGGVLRPVPSSLGHRAATPARGSVEKGRGGGGDQLRRRTPAPAGAAGVGGR